MSSILYMAWRYLASHRAKTVVLVLAVMLVAYLPAGLHVLVDQSQQELHARAASTPLLIGRRGSQTELALGSLYFRADAPDPLAYREVARIVESRLARAIPLLVRFQSQGDPIVGTNLDYFDFRGLTFADGVQMVRLGDCVLGATVARQRGGLPGSHVVSSPETVFDLTGGGTVSFDSFTANESEPGEVGFKGCAAAIFASAVCDAVGDSNDLGCW